MAVPGTKPQNFVLETAIDNTDDIAYVKETTGVFQDSRIKLNDFLASGGAFTLRGDWNAATNTPTLVSSTGQKGETFRVSTTGTTTLDGISSWEVNDLAYFDGAVWRKLESGVDPVTSVFTRIGNVVAAASDYDASQVDNDSTVTGTFVSDALDTLLGDIPIATEDVITIPSNGDTIFALSATPISTASVAIFVNGQLRLRGTDYTQAGTVLTWLDPSGVILLTTDTFQVRYSA